MRILLFTLLSVSTILHSQPRFEAQTIDADIAIGYGLAIGDVDGDGKPDIMLADKKQFVWYRNGDWKKFVLIENLTKSDNVCIAARDIDGDGKVEIAVGAQWNPGETSDTLASGSVHYLVRPADATAVWSAVRLHHEPTVHRMKWVRVAPNDFRLVVLPLHGRGNKNGAGEGVKVMAYKIDKRSAKWSYEMIDNSMHLTHNFDVIPNGDSENIAIGGKEGLKSFGYEGGEWKMKNWEVRGFSLGEVRQSTFGEDKYFASIEPMHGNSVTIHTSKGRTVLDSTLNQGHALACADVFGMGQNQILAGWREPDRNGNTGIRIYGALDGTGKNWSSYWLDENGIACEDLAVADLNGDSKPDVIAAGRSSKNLKIYWNRIMIR
jgi:hypothetical protein